MLPLWEEVLWPFLDAWDSVRLRTTFSFDAFVQRLAEGTPVSINQVRAPSFLFNVVVRTLNVPVPLRSNIHGPLIIHPDEVPQTIRETFSASLTEVRQNVL